MILMIYWIFTTGGKSVEEGHLSTDKNLRKCKCKDLVLVVYTCNLKERKEKYSKHNWKSRFLWYSPLIHQCIQTFGISERNVYKCQQSVSIFGFIYLIYISM